MAYSAKAAKDNAKWTSTVQKPKPHKIKSTLLKKEAVSKVYHMHSVDYLMYQTH